jgi:hypothetical protein
MNSVAFEENSISATEFMQKVDEIKEIIDFLILSDERDLIERQERISRSFDLIGGQYGLPNTKNEFIQSDPDYIIHGLARRLLDDNSLASIYNTEIAPNPNTPKYVEYLRKKAENKAFFDAYDRDINRVLDIEGVNISHYDEELGKEVPYDKNNPKHNPQLREHQHPRDRKYVKYIRRKAKMDQIKQNKDAFLYGYTKDYSIFGHAFLRDENGKVNLNEFEYGIDFQEKMDFKKQSFWALRDSGIVPNDSGLFDKTDYDDIMAMLYDNGFIDKFPEYKSIAGHPDYIANKAEEDYIQYAIDNGINLDDIKEQFRQNYKDISVGKMILEALEMAGKSIGKLLSKATSKLGI